MKLYSEKCNSLILLCVKNALDKYSMNIHLMEKTFDKMDIGSPKLSEVLDKIERLHSGTEIKHLIEKKKEEERVKKNLDTNKVVKVKRIKKKETSYKINEISIGSD